MLDSSSSKREKMVASGKRFELIVASSLKSIVDYPILLNREFFDKRIGRGMECDLILVTPFKIYCVECKNYNGYIAGNLYDNEWRFASSGRKSRVQNPYLLNKRRARLIRGLFYKDDYNPPKVENIIVMPDCCHIHVDYKHIFNITDFLNLVKLDCVTNKSVYRVDQISKFLIEYSKRRS